MNIKPCYYCHRSVLDDEEDGYVRVINEDESITLAHTECMEVMDDLVIEASDRWWDDISGEWG